MIDMPHRPTNFWSTVVKPYFAEEGTLDIRRQEDQVNGSDNDTEPIEQAKPTKPTKPTEPTKLTELTEPTKPTKPIKRCGRGRLKGSRNKVSNKETNIRRSACYYPAKDDDFDNQFIAAVIEEIETSMAFMTGKEQADMELALKLRKDSIITAPRALFEASTKQEVDGLIARGVFEFVQ